MHVVMVQILICPIRKLARAPRRAYHLSTMDINLMVINVGNTRLAVGVFEAGELRDVNRVLLSDRASVQEALKRAWAEIGGREGAAIAGAGVNPAGMEPVEHAVSEIT